MSVSVRLSVSVCVCLSVREHISRTARPDVLRMFGPTCGRGSVVLRRRCDKLCISGFMDDVIFMYM